MKTIVPCYVGVVAIWLAVIDELLYRLDEIPAALAIGQAACALTGPVVKLV